MTTRLEAWLRINWLKLLVGLAVIFAILLVLEIALVVS